MSKQTKSAEIATKGIQSASQFANLMSAVMADLLNEEITPEVGNVVCKAAKNMLDVIEMSHRHGNATFGNVFAATEKPKLLQSVNNGVNGSSEGKVKCNQCDERVSPRVLGEHKKTMHSVNESLIQSPPSPF